MAVDAETWTLVLWEGQARGLRWEATSTAGAAALSAALRVVDPAGQPGRDPWHRLHVGSQALGRLDRWVADLESQTAVVNRAGGASRGWATAKGEAAAHGFGGSRGGGGAGARRGGRAALAAAGPA